MRYCVIAAILLVAVTATAETTVYYDEGAFLDAIAAGGNYLLEDFDEYTEGSYQHFYLTLYDPVSAYGCDLSASGAGTPGLYSGDGVMSTADALSLIMCYFESMNPVYACGGYFWPADGDFQYIPGMTMELKLSDGTSLSYEPPGDAMFVGFVSDDTPYQWLTIDALDDLETPVYARATMDDFYVGAPEPTSLLLFGLAGLMLRRR